MRNMTTRIIEEDGGQWASKEDGGQWASKEDGGQWASTTTKTSTKRKPYPAASPPTGS